MTNGIIGVSILAMPYCFAKVSRRRHRQSSEIVSDCVFVFLQSGIILGIVMLVLSGIMTSYSCKLLIKSAVIQRSRTLEYLSFRTFGRNGKLLMEIWYVGLIPPRPRPTNLADFRQCFFSIILLLFGTLVTYQETLGDTAPSFLAKLFEVHVG